MAEQSPKPDPHAPPGVTDEDRVLAAGWPKDRIEWFRKLDDVTRSAVAAYFEKYVWRVRVHENSAKTAGVFAQDLVTLLRTVQSK